MAGPWQASTSGGLRTGSYLTGYVELADQNITNNQSLLRIRGWLGNNPSYGTTWSGQATSWSVSGVAGNNSGTFQVNVPTGGTQTFVDWWVWVTHNPDGTFSGMVRVDVGATGSPIGGPAWVYVQVDLPTIPRASTPSLSDTEVDAGSSVTVNIARAVPSFKHRVWWQFGVDQGEIAGNVDTSVNWTVPVALLNQIPNAVRGNGTIWVDTYSGSTMIGRKGTPVFISAPSSVVPTIANITHSEAVALVASKVGAYVQGQSKLNLAVTGAQGVYGSTIQTYTITVAGQAILGQSGTTEPVSASGTVAIIATVVDSRGRTGQKTVNVPVLAYQKPQITAQFRRALSNGTVSENGTVVRVDANTSVSSLVVGGTQKNTLTWKLQTKPRTSGSWATQGTWTGTVPAYNTWKTGDSVPVTESRDAILTVTDVLGNERAAQGIISTAVGVIHFTKDGRIGAGKYAEAGRGLDALGPIYQNDGEKVASEWFVIEQVPPGTILFGGYSAAPTGFLICNGSAVSRTTYAALYAAIGTRFGAGNGSSTFNLPNLSERVPVGAKSGSGEFGHVGATYGEKKHTQTVSEMPSHRHTMNENLNYAEGSTNVKYTVGWGSSRPNTGIQTDPTGEGKPFNIIQPSLALTPIIRF